VQSLNVLHQMHFESYTHWMQSGNLLRRLIRSRRTPNVDVCLVMIDIPASTRLLLKWGSVAKFVKNVFQETSEV
jgi:hypothetical protein